MKDTESQNAAILKYLQAGYSLTPLIALKKFGSLRCGARIFNLRKQGHNITTIMIPVGRKKKFVACYRLIK